jgi:TonB family protein
MARLSMLLVTIATLAVSPAAADAPAACATAPVQKGCGTFHWPNGSTYVGDFMDGAFDGHGIVTFPDGSTLESDFSQWSPTGVAVYRAKDGTTFKGKYRNPTVDLSQGHRPMHYPFWRGFFGSEASLTVAILVAPSGTVESAVITNPSPYDSFNDEAIAGILQWKYKPATVDGHPVPTADAVLLSFNNGR